MHVLFFHESALHILLYFCLGVLDLSRDTPDQPFDPWIPPHYKSPPPDSKNLSNQNIKMEMNGRIL
jgi:hypothetical protein